MPPLKQSYSELPLLVSKEVLLQKFRRYEWKNFDFFNPEIEENPILLCISNDKYKNPKFEFYTCSTIEELTILQERFEKEKLKGVSSIRLRLWTYVKSLPNMYNLTELDEMMFESTVQEAIIDLKQVLKEKNGPCNTKAKQNTGKRKS